MPADTTTAPRVGAYALIGHQAHLLLLADGENDAHVLPGGVVHTGEGVQQALRRVLQEQLAAIPAQLDFCAVIEHDTAEGAGTPAYEVAFLFDVTLTHPHRLAPTDTVWHRWVGEDELTSLSLRPEAIRNALTRGRLSAENSWWPGTP